MMTSPGADLRSWAGSLSPAWQAVVPGAFVWGATVVRPAGASASPVPLAVAVLGFVSLMLGPALERRWPKERGRLVAFWGFTACALIAIALSGLPGPLDPFEAVVGVLSWVLFGVTVAAPALGVESRGLHGRPDPSLSPRRGRVRRAWPYFGLAIGCSLVAFTLALVEPNRERATAFALLAPLGSLAVFAALGNQVRFGKGKERLRVRVPSLVLGLLAFGAATYVAAHTWQARRAAAQESPKP